MDKTYFADGFDEAVIGLNLEKKVPRVVYSKSMMIEILSEEFEKEGYEEHYSDAIEYLEFNTWVAYVGQGTPLYLDDTIDEDFLDFYEDEEIEKISYTPMDIDQINDYIDNLEIEK